MKKLTKTLSLVLVVAMVLGLCVIGAGATFTDKDKVTKDYNEAITVMTDLKVVGGYKDGSFKPAGTLTRAEACVILANMTLGTTAASALAPSTVTFKDVPASFWGYKYVEYCYQSGYIAGTGAGKFSPNSTLTGYQWALMLMRVLGYDMTALTTGNWQINTAKVYYAANTKFSDVAISGAAVTREAATTMAHNALFYANDKTQGYAITKTIYTDNTHTTVVSSTKVGYYDTQEAATAQAAMLNALDGDAKNTYTVGSKETINPGTTLGKTVFGVTQTVSADDFGRSATFYTAKDTTLGAKYGWTNAKVSYVVAPKAEYTTAVTGAKVLADLGATKALTSATKIVDGVSAPCTEITANNNAYVGGTGNGVLTQVYYDAVKNTATVVEVNTYFGVVSAVNAATSVTPATVTVVPGAYATMSGFVGGKVPATGLKTNDFVLYTVAKNTDNNNFTVESVAAAQKQTLTATSYVANTNFTAGGTTYQYSATKNGVIADYTTAHDVYLDSYGYAIAVMGATSVANYAVSLKAAPAGGLDGGYSARLLMTDGKTADVAIDKASYDLLVPDPTHSDAKMGQIVSWTKNAATSVYTLTDAVSGDALYTGKAVDVKTGVPTFTLNSVPYYANNNTVFLTRNGDGLTHPYTYAAYTGIANVPALSGSVNADVVVINGYASVVYVDGASAVSSTNAAKVYLTGVSVPVSDSVKGDYFICNAIVDGVAKQVNLVGTHDAGLYSAISYNTNGVGVATPATVGTYHNGYGVVGLTAGIIKLAGTDLVAATDCAVYYVSKIPSDPTAVNPATDGVGSVSSVAGIVTDASDYVTYTTNLAGQVTSIYIQSKVTNGATLDAAKNVKATVAGVSDTCLATLTTDTDHDGTYAKPIIASVTVTAPSTGDSLAVTLCPTAGATVAVISSNIPTVATVGDSYTATYAVTSEDGLTTLYYKLTVKVATAAFDIVNGIG